MRRRTNRRADAGRLVELRRTSRNIVARMERSEIRDSRDAGPGLRFAPSGLQRRDLPVGRFLDRRVESYFWFSEKYFCSHLPQIRSRTFRIPSHRGGVSGSSETRDGMRWT